LVRRIPENPPHGGFSFARDKLRHNRRHADAERSRMMDFHWSPGTYLLLVDGAIGKS
jgi:hypothetical protein